MYERPSKPEWPLNALPKHWIDALFAKMVAFYGDKFTMMWRGAKVEEVQKAWAIELFKLTREQLKAGSDALTAFPKPPTLPEFVNHCKQRRAEQAASAAAKIENLPKATPEQVESNLNSIRTASASVRNRVPTAEWAFKLMLRGSSPGGYSIPFGPARCATDAITSKAGQRVVDTCADPVLKAQYAELRQTTIDSYRMREMKLWETP
jgi:hypothetical protein